MPKKRTHKQNDALQPACRELADELNSRGLDMRKVLKETYNIWWTQDNVRRDLFNQLAKAMYGVKSSKELDTYQIGEVWKLLQRELWEKFELEVKDFAER